MRACTTSFAQLDRIKSAVVNIEGRAGGGGSYHDISIELSRLLLLEHH